MKHLLCTGGGTAGHVLPTLPVIERVLAQGGQVSYIGSRSGLEKRLLQGADLSYFGISSGKLRRYFSWSNVTDLFRIVAGVFQALLLLRRLRPDVVFSKGGFVSFPVVLAAWLLRIPTVAHESDISPGLANRMAMPFLHTLCLNFDATRAGSFRGHPLLTGTPLRADLLAGDRERGRRSRQRASSQQTDQNHRWENPEFICAIHHSPPVHLVKFLITQARERQGPSCIFLANPSEPDRSNTNRMHAICWRSITHLIQ